MYILKVNHNFGLVLCEYSIFARFSRIDSVLWPSRSDYFSSFKEIVIKICHTNFTFVLLCCQTNGLKRCTKTVEPQFRNVIGRYKQPDWIELFSQRGSRPEVEDPGQNKVWSAGSRPEVQDSGLKCRIKAWSAGFRPEVQDQGLKCRIKAISKPFQHEDIKENSCQTLKIASRKAQNWEIWEAKTGQK